MAVLCFVVSTKEVPVDDNEFELNGVQYVAVEDDGNEGCNQCSFNMAGTGCAFAPPCIEDERVDGRNVIFMEKQQ